jgi:hypothetical protein
MKTNNKIKYDVYLNVICFIARYVTPNLKRLYLDVNVEKELAQITAFYVNKPTELELELLDDIETNSISRSPNIIFEQSKWLLVKDLNEDEYKRHDFLLFSFYEGHKD